MADAAEQHGFTRAQIEFLRETLAPTSAQGFDRPTLMWMFGGLLALGLAVSGVLWAEIGSVRDEIGSVRDEIGSVRTELRTEIRENRAAISANRDAIAELAEGVTRIEAILEERLPRDR